MIDADAIIKRVSEKPPEEPPAEEASESEYSVAEEDKHLGDAFDAVNRGDKSGFIKHLGDAFDAFIAATNLDSSPR